MFKLDKTISKAHSFKDAENDKLFDKNLPYIERLKEAYYLIAQAYDFPVDNPPRMNKQVFSTRKHK
jgi:hypothetical protein